MEYHCAFPFRACVDGEFVTLFCPIKAPVYRTLKTKLIYLLSSQQPHSALSINVMLGEFVKIFVFVTLINCNILLTPPSALPIRVTPLLAATVGFN